MLNRTVSLLCLALTGPMACSAPTEPPPGMSGDGDAKVFVPGPDLATNMMTAPDLRMSAQCASCIMGVTMQNDCEALIAACQMFGTDKDKCPKDHSCGFDLPSAQCPMGKTYNWTAQLVGQLWACVGQNANSQPFTPTKISNDGEPLRVEVQTRAIDGVTNHLTCVDDFCWSHGSASPLIRTGRLRMLPGGTTMVSEIFDQGVDALSGTPRVVATCTPQ